MELASLSAGLRRSQQTLILIPLAQYVASPTLTHSYLGGDQKSKIFFLYQNQREWERGGKEERGGNEERGEKKREGGKKREGERWERGKEERSKS